MTQHYLHCPICINNIDVSMTQKIDLPSGAVLIQISCSNCEVNTQIIMSWDDYWHKTHRGSCQDHYKPCRMKGNG